MRWVRLFFPGATSPTNVFLLGFRILHGDPTDSRYQKMWVLTSHTLRYLTCLEDTESLHHSTLTFVSFTGIEVCLRVPVLVLCVS